MRRMRYHATRSVTKLRPVMQCESSLLDGRTAAAKTASKGETRRIRMDFGFRRCLAAVAIAAIPTILQARAAAQPNPAAEHLAAARTALNKVLNSPVPAGDTFKKVSELKTEYLLLERAASTASPEWLTHYAAIDRLLVDLLGPSSSSKEAGAVGTSGRAGSPGGQLDAGVAASLQEFRTHMTAFNAAMSRVTASVAPAGAPPAPPAAAAPPPAAAAAPAATAPAPPATAPPAVPPASAPTAVAPAADADAIALVDQVTTMVDRALGTGAPASDTVQVDRAMLEQMKKQLEQIKQSMKKP